MYDFATTANEQLPDISRERYFVRSSLTDWIVTALFPQAVLHTVSNPSPVFLHYLYFDIRSSRLTIHRLKFQRNDLVFVYRIYHVSNLDINDSRTIALKCHQRPQDVFLHYLSDIVLVKRSQSVVQHRFVQHAFDIFELGVDGIDFVLSRFVSQSVAYRPDPERVR